MRKLIVIGGSGFAKEVIWLAKSVAQHNIVGILDDNAIIGSLVSGIPILGKTSSVENYLECEFVVAIGNPRVRKKIVGDLIAAGVQKFATLIHPSVNKSDLITIGEGTVVCAGATLTVDIKIGKHNIININSTIGHDCVFGDFCTIAPLAAISGNVILKDMVEVGTGAAIRQGLTLEDGAMLGMGAVLTKPIPKNQVFIGNPATFFKSF